MNDAGFEIIAFCVDRDHISKSTLAGIPVISMDELSLLYPPDSYRLALGIGYKKLGDIRRNIFNRCKSQGYEFINYIHPSTHIDRTMIMGEGNIVFENVVIQKDSLIGNANLFFSNCTIMHDNIVGCFNTFAAGSVSNGSVKVGDCCFIGSNSTLRDSINLAYHTLVGAGVYVNHDTEDNMAITANASNIIPGRGVQCWQKNYNEQAIRFCTRKAMA